MHGTGFLFSVMAIEDLHQNLRQTSRLSVPEDGEQGLPT